MSKTNFTQSFIFHLTNDLYKMLIKKNVIRILDVIVKKLFTSYFLFDKLKLIIIIIVRKKEKKLEYMYV